MTPQQLVLIVDDSRDVREAMAALLEQEGFLVMQAATGREALWLLKRAHACLVVLDLAMPEMDGFAFRQDQLADPQIADIPVVAVSATGLADEKRATSMGMRFFRKPVIELDALVGVVREHCAA